MDNNTRKRKQTIREKRVYMENDAKQKKALSNNANT